MILWRRVRPLLSALVRFMHISYIEAKSQYYGTRLGLWWLPLSTLLFTAMLALVFRHSDTMAVSDFFLYVLSGYILWQFIQDTINGSVDAIQKKLEFAIHNSLSLAGLFGKLLMDRLFEYGVNLALLITAMLIFAPTRFGTELILFAPFLVIIVLTSLALSYLVNLLTVFFPDLATLIKTGTRFVFFASPIFWVANEQTGVRHFLVNYNPISYYLGIGRQVFGISPVDWKVWLWALAISTALCLAGLIAFERSKTFVRNIK